MSEKMVEMSIVGFVSWLQVVTPGEKPEDHNTLAELYQTDSISYLHGKFQSLQERPISWFTSLDYSNRSRLAEIVYRRMKEIEVVPCDGIEPCV